MNSLLTTTKNTRWCVEGTCIRSDLPKHLTNKDERRLVEEYNVKTIIDLRRYRERLNKPVLTKFKQQHPEVVAISHPVYEFSKQGDGTPINNIMYYTTSINDDFFALIEFIKRRIKEGTVLFHCHSGKDRTGMVAACLEYDAGVPLDKIVTDYMLSNKYLSNLGLYSARPENILSTIGTYSALKKPVVTHSYDVNYITDMIHQVCNDCHTAPQDIINKIDIPYLLQISFELSAEKLQKDWGIRPSTHTDTYTKDDVKTALSQLSIEIAEW